MTEDDYRYEDIDINDIDPVEFCFWCPSCMEPANLCWCGMTAEPEDE
jgi:hypothetical protein